MYWPLRMNAEPKSLESITPSQSIITQNNGLINMKSEPWAYLGRRPYSLDFSNPAGGLSLSIHFCRETFLSLLFLHFFQSQHPPYNDIQTWHSLEENCALLSYFTACSGNLLPTFRDSLSVPSIIDWPLKMGPTACPETSVITTARFVMTQKSAALIYDYFEAEAWNHAYNKVQFTQHNVSACVQVKNTIQSYW
jgi:hypothetical protein